MRSRWRPGNHLELLENGEEFFPRVFDAIDAASDEVLVETFILNDDEVGTTLQQSLIQAARRGVRVELTVDGWGSMGLPRAFTEEMVAGGVCLHVFDLVPAWRLRIAWFRRLHRKLVVADGQRAFVGGINFGDDHLVDSNPAGKQDYAVEVRGPVVADVQNAMRVTLGSVHRELRRANKRSRRSPSSAGNMDALFVTRNNGRSRTVIERHYLQALASARQRVIIANAYFLPGYRFLRALSQAAKRGVDVRLVLQGEPDLPLVQLASRLLYEQLLRRGVRIFEYCKRAFHGKVAVVDDEWVTVGSSNLDPLSLAMNLEANLVVRSRALNAQVAARLERLMTGDCTEVTDREAPASFPWRPLGTAVVYHFLRHFPQWSGWLPAHAPRLTAMRPEVSRSPDLGSR